MKSFTVKMVIIWVLSAGFSKTIQTTIWISGEYSFLFDIYDKKYSSGSKKGAYGLNEIPRL